ncbi:MAG: hypothetical protein V9H69_02930 [Anaerolineae bacterium]
MYRGLEILLMTKSSTITIELPGFLATELSTVADEFVTDVFQRGLRDLRIERALERYRLGGTSFGAAANAAGVSKSELALHAYARGLEPPFDRTILVEELA